MVETSSLAVTVQMGAEYLPLIAVIWIPINVPMMSQKACPTVTKPTAQRHQNPAKYILRLLDIKMHVTRVFKSINTFPNVAETDAIEHYFY